MSDAAPEPTAESLEVIRKFAETYAQRTGTYFCAEVQRDLRCAQGSGTSQG